MLKEQGIRVEDVGYKNIRFLGYNFLQNVTYNSEPVVPKIMSQGKGVFRVEEIQGQDIRYPSIWNWVTVPDKFKLLYHVVGQLKEIDKAGIVLFDREGRNIVANTENGGLSVRQVDLEEFYDKNADAVYADINFRQVEYTDTIDKFKNRGFNLWAESVQFLGNQAKVIVIAGHVKKNKNIFDKYNRISTEPESNKKILQKDLLGMLQGDLAKMVDSF